MQSIAQGLSISEESVVAVSGLEKMGTVISNANHYAYAKVADDYIHRVFPLIKEPGVIKPDYFSEKTNFMGAHISLFYPEEGMHKIPALPEKIKFNVKGLYSINIAKRQCFIVPLDG